MAFPSTVLGLTVELALGADITAAPSTWVWTDVTSYVYARDLVRIQRGRPDGATQTPPSLCTFTANNRDGRWCAYDPSGAWFGQIGRGTPVRISVDEGTPSVRWTGFLSALPTRWSPAETDRYVQVQASGILQRLERQTTPLRSPMVRAVSQTPTPPVAYWPGEDDSQATTLAEFRGGAPMTWTGLLTPASSSPAGSNPLPEFTTFVGLQGSVPSYPASGAFSVAFLVNFPAAPSGDTVLLRWKTAGSLPTWQLVLNPIGGVDTITLEAYDAGGTIRLSDPTTYGSLTIEAYGDWMFIQINVVQNGADFDYALVAWNVSVVFEGAIGGSNSSGTVTGQTVGVVTTLSVPSTAKTNGMLAGHWAVWDVDVSLVLDTLAAFGVTHEFVGDRAERLANQEGLTGAVFSDSHIPMGPQEQDTFLALMRGCEAVSNGRLIEVMDPTIFDLSIALLQNTDLENIDSSMTLDHDASNLVGAFEPTDDDLHLINDVTSTRSGASGLGSFARAVADSGRLTPAQVGTYADSVSVNVETDEQLPDQAQWRVNVGTVEGLRVPTLTINLAHDPDLIPDWIGVDIGSRITVANPPAGIPPDDIDLLVEGWTEVLANFTWEVALNCSPYKPWRVFQLAETASDTDPYLGRLCGDEDSALRANATSGATSFLVDPNRTFWTTAADDFPLNLRVGGEVVTASGIATSAATFVNVGAATSGDNSSRTPSLPASTAAGDLIVIVAAIRSSGTGSVNVPSGYVRLPIWRDTDNVAVMAKVSGASESSPVVTFNDGVAGDTCTAFIFAFRGTPVSLADLTDIVVGDPVVQLNGSAANIAYGGIYPYFQERCIHILVGWKQDDYTSVAPPTGFTEMIEASTTSGSDQSLYVAYKIDTTPSVTVEGSLAVTGGASAISRSALFCLASGYQTFTLSARGVNAVTKAQTASTKVAVEDPAVLAL